MKRPKALKKGSTIGVISPASSTEKNRIKKLEKILKNEGFNVVMGKAVYESNKYLAGTDEERAEDLNYMFKNEEIDGILCVRGGYGTPRILDLLDYETIEENPKVFIGYSDITAVHVALNQKCNLITYHGPMGSSDIVDGFNEESKENLEKVVLKNGKNKNLENPKKEKFEIINKGVVKGSIIGGNLSLLVDLIGTDYEVDTKGKILFIEEIGEEPRNIDRMLNQLRLSGKLDDAIGIILGDFNNCTTENISFTLDEVLDQYFKGINKPVLKNFKAGHCEPMITIPFGVKVKLDCNLGEVIILEDTVL